MPLIDLPLEQLRAYRPTLPEPEDFDAFWDGTLAVTREAARSSAPADFRPLPDSPLTTVDVHDVRFPGWGGQPVAAWLLLPRAAERPLPAVVTCIGYSGGRGLHTEHLLWSAAGYAHLVVDNRGQGHDTADPDPVPGPHYVGGFMTRGAEGPEHHYYRRLMADCVRAVDVLREHPAVDPERVVVSGASQGGGLALAVAGLAGDAVAAVLADVPFLCHIARGAEAALHGPYAEIVHYLGVHRRSGGDGLFSTLGYFDAVHFARRATAPALFSVGLMDPVCPPSTVFAAFNHYGALRDPGTGRAVDKDITVWPFGDHAGGGPAQQVEQLGWLAARGLGPDGAAQVRPDPDRHVG
ncbi:acetylxylan esterase [Streptomyces sp. HNM0574]|uniref:acetylxylan esterase n=1 Tax=Streptomyces sp. HNM0574 TaxID=2714954 RepID=UPI00146D04FE|nr:acetylxylan esterase [Streptomyces sp. HNM0574]NLU68715.1 acetylxylan esterase [Streptomyces sp. HNM0574]